MKLKICGMKYPENIMDVAGLKPDFMGFIFYPKSVRCVEVSDVKEVLEEMDPSIRKIGVFVNQPADEVADIVDELKLDYVQLHGDESIDYVTGMKKLGYRIIKVVQMDRGTDWNVLTDFVPLVDFFLFDTRSPSYGGSGQHFDWSLLSAYDHDIPFFLSGGLKVEDVREIHELGIEQLYAIDVNSRLESAPAMKDIQRIIQLKKELEKWT